MGGSILKPRRIAVFLLVASLLFAAVLVVPSLFDMDKYARQLADALSDSLGAPVLIESGRLAILPDVSFIVSGIRIPSAVGPVERLTVPQARIDLDVLSLLRGKVLVEEIHVYDPCASIALREAELNCHWNSEFPRLDLTASSDMLPQSLDVGVDDGTLIFMDEFLASPSTLAATLQEVDIDIDGLGATAPFEIEAACELNLNGKAAEIEGSFRVEPSSPGSRGPDLPFRLLGEVEVRDLVIAQFAAYFPEVLRLAGLSGSADIDLSVEMNGCDQATLTADLVASRFGLSRSLCSKGSPRKHDLDVSVKSKINRHGLTVPYFYLGVDDSNKFGGQLSVGWAASDATLTAAAAVFRFPIDTVLSLLPEQLAPPDAARALREMSVSGNLSMFDLQFRGRLADPLDDLSLFPRSLFGSVSLTDVAVAPIYETVKIEGVSFRADFFEGVAGVLIRRGSVSVNDRDGQVVSIPITGSLGLSTFHDLSTALIICPDLPNRKKPELGRFAQPLLSGSLKTDVRLEQVARFVSGLPSLDEKMSLVGGLKGAEGKVSARCDFTSFLMDPYDPDYNMDLSLTEGKAVCGPMRMALEQVSLQASASPQSACIALRSRLDDQAPVSISLTATAPFSDSLSVSIEADAHLPPSYLRKLLHEAGVSSLAVEGEPVNVSASASGGLDSLGLSVQSDLTNQDIRFGDWFLKPAGEACRLELTGTASSLRVFSINDASLSFRDVSLLGEGSLACPEQPVWAFSAYLNQTAGSEIARFLPGITGSDLDMELRGWIRIKPPTPLGSDPCSQLPEPSSNECEAAIALRLGAQSIGRLLVQEIMPEWVREEAEKVSFTSGEAQFEATGKFALDKPKAAEVKASVDLRGLSFRHADVGLPFEGITGVLELDDEILQVQQVSGQLGASDFELSGEVFEPVVALLAEDAFGVLGLDLHLSSKLTVADLEALLGSGLLDPLRLSEPLAAELTIAGSPYDLRLKSSVSMVGAELDWAGKAPHGGGAELDVEIAARLLELSRLYVDSGQLTLGPSSLKFSITAMDAMPSGVQLQAASELIRMKDVAPLLPVLRSDGARGGFSISAEATVDAAKGDLTNFHARALAKDVSFGLAASDRRIEGLGFDVEASPSLVILNGLGLKLGQSRVSIDARADFESRSLSFRLDSPELDGEDFVAAFACLVPDEPSSTESTLATSAVSDVTWLGQIPFLSDGSLDASVSVAKFKMGKHDFGKIELRLPVRDGVASIRGLKGPFCHGEIGLDASAELLSATGPRLSTSFAIKEAKLQEMLRLFGAQRIYATGKAHLLGSIETRGRDTRELIKQATGSLDFRSSNGTIKKFGMLSKVFGLMDVLRVFKLSFRDFVTTGTPYKSLAFTAELRDGHFSTQDFFMQGSSMKITAVCDIDLVNETIEATAGVFLLPTMGSIASKVPFVGPIITRDNETMLASYFNIHGPVGDPKVNSVEIKKVKEGTVSLFRSLLSGLKKSKVGASDTEG